MRTIKDSPDNSELRRQAEEKLKEATSGSKDLSGVSPERMTNLIHELQVHQVELKMQNDELRHIQGELEKARDRYFHLYDFAPVGYFTVSEKGIIEEVNLTGAAMIGIERSALIGTPFSRFVFRDGQGIFYKHLRCLLETETSQSCELRFINKDGHKFYARMECMVLKNSGEAFREIRAVVSDITDSKLVEKKIKEYSEKLEKQVDFLQRMEAMGIFAGGIVHDFTNLLTVILSYSRFALDGVGPGSSAREDIEKIIQNAKNGLLLTHWLKRFSRDQPSERKVTNLNEVITDMEKMLRCVITNKIDLVKVLEPDLGRTLVDPAQVELMIINLVVNAVDAMPEGGLVTIATANEESCDGPVQKGNSGRQEPKVMLSVKDTGIGMDKETMSKIFEPFFTTKKKGTGLGLAIAFDAVYKNDGFIRVYSRIGQGSTFKIYLPRVHEE